MDYKKLISHINSKNWYRQGAAVKLLYISYPYEACSRFTVSQKQIEPYYYGYVGFHRDDFMNYYFTRGSAETVCNFYLDKQKGNGIYLQNLQNKWESKLFFPTVKMCSKVSPEELKSQLTKELLSNYKKFSKIYEASWQESIFLDGFDIHSEEIASEIVKKYGLPINKEGLQILTSPNQRTWSQKAEVELLKLLYEKSNLREKIKAYAEKWNWLQNDYAHVEKLNHAFFQKKVQNLKNKPFLLKKEVESLRQFEVGQKLRSRLLKKIKHQPKATGVLNGLASLAVWRDTRKAMTQIASQTAKLYVAEIAKRYNAKLSDLENLFYWEIENFLQNSKEIKKLIASRKGGVMVSDFPGRKIQILPMKKSEKQIKELLVKIVNRKELEGSTAYPGLVQGKIKIIKSQKDFYKMKRGDILVAPNTRPEYVPIMKLAGAIISEEGGITCHSAIVSRELKIPCIVGVQGATDQLKDGDLVKVDADKGTVEKM